MANTRSQEDREATAKLAAAYLDMWETIATAHALKGPPSDTHEPHGSEHTDGDADGDERG